MGWWGNSQSHFVLELGQTSGKPHANRGQTSGRPWANLRQTLSRPHTNLGQTSCRPHANFRQTLGRPCANLRQTSCQPWAEGAAGGHWEGVGSQGAWPVEGVTWWGEGQYGVGNVGGVLRNIFNCITTSASAFHCFTEWCKDRLDLRGGVTYFSQICYYCYYYYYYY